MKQYLPLIERNFYLINEYVNMTFDSFDTKNIEVDKTYERAALCSNESFIHQFQNETEAHFRAKARFDLTQMVLSPDPMVIT